MQPSTLFGKGSIWLTATMQKASSLPHNRVDITSVGLTSGHFCERWKNPLLRFVPIVNALQLQSHLSSDHLIVAPSVQEVFRMIQKSLALMFMFKLCSHLLVECRWNRPLDKSEDFSGCCLCSFPTARLPYSFSWPFFWFLGSGHPRSAADLYSAHEVMRV